MREDPSLLPLAAGGLTAFAFVAAILLFPGDALAEGTPRVAVAQAQTPQCNCPGTSIRRQKPKYADLTPGDRTDQALDPADEVAVLARVQQALSGTADGATYVWHRGNGSISGLVKPTTSFKNVEGNVCRHLIVMLTTGDKTRKAEGVACRSPTGVWTLEG